MCKKYNQHVIFNLSIKEFNQMIQGLGHLLHFESYHQSRYIFISKIPMMSDLVGASYICGNLIHNNILTHIVKTFVL